MPELPEVETVVRGLRGILVGRTFARVAVRAPSSSIEISSSLEDAKLDSLLAGRTVESVLRRGKNILIGLSGDLTLWVHLKMTGRFLYLERGIPRHKHDLVVFDLEPDGRFPVSRELRFHDTRRFGRLRLYPNHELWLQAGLAELGPEPLEIPPGEFIARCRRRPRMLKPALLDQTFLAGLGNIYADESLHLAGLHPRRITTTVSSRKLGRLHTGIRKLLQRAIRLMGTTMDSFSGVNGDPGGFQHYLRVYSRAGRPCRTCGTKINRIVLAGRSTHFCTRCQRPG
jgi:formamidopyrimidine-DNA glycosylase